MKGRRNEAWGTKKGKREEVAARQRAVVDITAVIHLPDSLPKAPLGDTQSCVTLNAANAHKHTQRHKHTLRNDMLMIPGFTAHAHAELHVLAQGYVAGHGQSMHTPLHSNLYAAQITATDVRCSHTHTCSLADVPTHIEKRHCCIKLN